MDQINMCPKCHQSIDTTKYFCPNCGLKLHETPLLFTFFNLVVIIIKVVMLPPMGIFWGYKYFKQDDNKTKIIGAVMIVITLLETIWIAQSTIAAIKTVNNQFTQQMNLNGL
ncbi:MAG: zinc ribbon domain-containing protein [Candidatus Shapirobacteria bacterium]|jgi:RNA polymerase subunit RPABC4/transcription elongation factor Spt4